MPFAVPIASRAPTIDKTNGSLLLTFARGTRGEIDCFVMSESLFTIDWFLNGWPIRDVLFETEYQVISWAAAHAQQGQLCSLTGYHVTGHDHNSFK